MKNAEVHFKYANDEYYKLLDEYRVITREFERRQSAFESAKKVKVEWENKFEELEKRRAELANEIKANGCDVAAVWDDILRQCFGK